MSVQLIKVLLEMRARTDEWRAAGKRIAFVPTMGYLLQFGALEGFAASAAPYLRKHVEAARATAEQLGVDLGLLGEVAKRGPLDLA